MLNASEKRHQLAHCSAAKLAAKLTKRAFWRGLLAIDSRIS